MIKCFKCDTEITKGVSGNLIYNCNCFPVSTIEYVSGDIYTAMAGAIPGPAQPTPDGLQYCQGCGAPMLQPDHTCRKVEPITLEAKPNRPSDFTPAMAERLDILREDARLEDEEKYKQHMKLCIEHLKTCSTCKYLSQVDGSVCVDMRKLRSMRDMRITKGERVK